MQDEANYSDWRAILKHEFAAGEGSFTLRLRCGHWDKEAHARLFVAMRECCKAHDGQTRIERWIADGFWWLDFYTREHFADSDDNYKANQSTNFNHLAFWLFTGQGRADDEFEPISE